MDGNVNVTKYVYQLLLDRWKKIQSQSRLPRDLTKKTYSLSRRELTSVRFVAFVLNEFPHVQRINEQPFIPMPISCSVTSDSFCCIELYIDLHAFGFVSNLIVYSRSSNK